jgi:ribosomal protein S18 acetylase RimI-like enzyme
MPQEYDAVGKLTLRAYQPVLAGGSDDPYRQVLRDTKARADAADVLVAVSPDDTLLGTVTLALGGTAYADIARPDELEVRMLAVDPSVAGAGIGRSLMAATEQRAHQMRHDLVLSVIGTNSDAISFYRHLGYQPSPERDWYPIPGLALQVFVRRHEELGDQSETT